MKINSSLLFSGALATAVVAACGCRTIHSSDYSYYPKTKDAPAVAEPEAEKPVSPVAVPSGEAEAVVAEGKAPAAAVSVAGAPDAAPVPVQDAASVGKAGTYREFVITDDGADRSYAFTSDGLQGQTGRHVPAPAPAPAPEPAASAAAAPVAAGSGSYVVQSGDILGRIARKHNVSEKAILEANPSVKDPNRIRVGQRLAIPAAGTGLNKAGASKVAKKAVAKAPAAAKKAAATLPEKPGFVVYVVKPGDILGRVAKSHGTSVKAIMEANNIVDDRKVRAGKAIYIPSSGASSAADSAVRGDVSPAPAVAEEPVAPRVGPAVPEFEPAAGASDPYLSL